MAEDETDSITDSMNMNSSKLPEIVEERGVCHAAAHGVTKEFDTKLNSNNNSGIQGSPHKGP